VSVSVMSAATERLLSPASAVANAVTFLAAELDLFEGCVPSSARAT